MHVSLHPGYLGKQPGLLLGFWIYVVVDASWCMLTIFCSFIIVSVNNHLKTKLCNLLVAKLDFHYTLISFNILIRYCECFASGIYCDGCNCVNCYNNVENEAARREAVEATLERNPNAFRPKIASSPHGARDSRVCGSAVQERTVRKNWSTFLEKTNKFPL